MRIKKHLFTNGFIFPSLPNKFSQYKCPNCNSITDSEHNNVTNCPSCGASPLALVAHLSVAPDGIIPFSLPKNEISNYFKQWLKKKIFAPRSLKKLKRFDVLKSIYYRFSNQNQQLTENRLAICNKCEHRLIFMNEAICDQCGCILENKTRLKEEKCDLCKW